MFIVEQLLTKMVEGYGHVLFTSRNRDLSRLGTLLEIPPMETEDGVRLLLRGYNDNDIQGQHKNTASSIVKRLGNLALAIDQAAAYIEYKRIPVDRLGDFQTTYEVERQKILSHTPKNFWEYEHINAFTTWELSFQQLISGNEPWKKDVAHFLTLSAFFAPTKISESLFRFYQRAHDSEVRWIQMFSTSDIAEENRNEESSEEIDTASKQACDPICDDKWSADRFWDIIVDSDDLSLLQSISPAVGHQGTSFSLHPIIRDWLQLRLTKNECWEYTQEAILILGCCVKTYGNRSAASLEERTALTTHMDVSMSNDERFSKPQDKLGANIVNCTTASLFAAFYEGEGRYRISEDLRRRVAETRRSRLGERDLLTLASMSDLASILWTQGKYGDAEQIYRQTIPLMETELGETHPDTLDCMNSLALLLSSQKKYGEAEFIYRSTLTLREKEREVDDLSIVRNRNGLALVLSLQEKYSEAEHICRSTLLGQVQSLGKEHPCILNTMVQLAETQAHQNKYEEAERMCRQTLIVQETIFGSEHPDTLSSLQALMMILRNQGKHEEAEKVCRRILVVQETQIGNEHPETLMTMLDVALILEKQNRYDEAVKICQRILTLRENTLGPEHPDNLSIMENLAWLLKEQGTYPEAESASRKILISRENLLGPEHPDTLSMMEDLVWLLKKQGKYPEAKSVCRQILTIREKVLGKEHPDTLRVMELLRIFPEQMSPENATLSVGRRIILGGLQSLRAILRSEPAAVSAE